MLVTWLPAVCFLDYFTYNLHHVHNFSAELQSNLLALTAEGCNYGEFRYDWLHEKHAVATLNLGAISEFT
jgi:hypothetical protein